MPPSQTIPVTGTPVAIDASTTSSIPKVDIKRVPFESPTYDVMQGCSRHEVRVYDHGFVALVDAMPRLVPAGQTADAAIVQAARVSYGQGTKQINEDRGLIRYLLRHRHTTPFEMIEFKFHIAMPIFIARQWIRHRTANVNEYSARYSIVPDRFYKPTIEQVRKQSGSNRQGGEERFRVLAEGIEGSRDQGIKGGAAENGPDEAILREHRTAQEFLTYLEDAEKMYQRYLALTEAGVSREMARIALPVSVYTEWYWKCDLHNTLRFLSLRLDPHAQEEIRVYAQAMYNLLEPIIPITMEAFRDYELDAMHLTRLEIDAIRARMAGGDGALAGTNKRESAEWDAKRRKLGIL